MEIFHLDFTSDLEILKKDREYRMECFNLS